MNACKPNFAIFVAKCLMGLVYILSFVPTVCAADSDRVRIEFDRVDIPANLPNLWPIEIKQMAQESRQKFLNLLEQINAKDRGPRIASLKSAHYEATLVNDTLQGGVLTASVRKLGNDSALLELGKFSFALDELKWQGQAAIWGSGSDGRTWVFTDGTKDELLGEWSCRGRTIPGGFDFDLYLPPATTSFMDLRIPRDFSVIAPAAEVTLLSTDPSEQLRLWRIQFGGDSHCRLTFLAREVDESKSTSLLVRQEMEVVIREGDLRFQMDLQLEALEAPVHEVTLKIPPGLKIHNAVYGADTPVPIVRSVESDLEGRISVGLPGLLKGVRRTLHLNGSVLQREGQQTNLPHVIVDNSSFEGGKLTVAVQSPLQVRSIRSLGYKQRTANNEQSQFTFQQLTADAQLIFDIHRASNSMTGDILSVLAVDEDSWNLTSEIRWKSLTGSFYQTSCVFPRDWEVTDVRPKPDTVRTSSINAFNDPPKLNWDVKSYSGGRTELIVEFLDSILPNQSRTVVVTAERKPPSPDQSVPTPLPQLLNCETEKLAFGLEIPSSMTSVFSTDSRLERDARPTPNSYLNSSERPKYERRWYRCESPDELGTLRLLPRLQPVNVTAETIIEALPAEYRLKYSIHAQQMDSQLDRLLVYLTEPSPDIRWVWKGLQTLELNATNLAKPQHVEWDLPSSGELWEIRLPRSIANDVIIEGTATTRWPVNHRPPLLFVPQAIEKLVTLKLTNPDNVTLVYDADGMKQSDQSLSWKYSTPQAEFRLAVQNPEPSRDFPPMVMMQLQTRLSANADGSDLYRAVLQLENGSSHDALRIKLDATAILQEVFVSGEPVNVMPQFGEFTIPGLNSAGREKVELIYRVRATAKSLFERRRIVVPEIDSQILDFTWNFSIPHSSRIFSSPTGVRLIKSPVELTWNERLFGPLGRSQSENIFHPMQWQSWRTLFHPEPYSARTADISDADFMAEIEWQSIGPNSPQEIWVELWHAERVQLLSWISLGVCLLIGITLRMCNWKYRDRVAAYGLSLTVAAAFSVPSPYAFFFGGATAGMAIAILLPRRILLWKNPIDRSLNPSRQDHRRAFLTLSLVLLSIYGSSQVVEFPAIAQEVTSEDTPFNKRPVVYIPVDSNDQPSETLPWVYVARETLEHWKSIAGEVGIKPNYLISTARYRIEGSQNGNLNLTALYRVHILPSSEEFVTVLLPLTDVSLPDVDSCRVNGVAYPINVLPNGTGYSIELTRLVTQQSEPVQKQLSEADIATFEIELHTRKPHHQSSNIDLKIPSVAKSQLEFYPNEPVAYAEIVGSRGSTIRDENSHSLISELGATSSIQLRWGPSNPPEKPSRIAASMLQYLELHSGYSELTFHLEATPEEGLLNFLEFQIPENAVVRKIHCREDNLLQDDVLVTKDGDRKLRLVFEKQHSTQVTIDGQLLLKQPDSLAQVPLPKFSLATSKRYQHRYSRNWWGISTSIDFRLETSNLDPDKINTIAAAPYLNAWKVAEEFRPKTPAEPRQHDSAIRFQPQSTFELRDGTTPLFALVAYQPTRQASNWMQTGNIGRNRLEWSVEGEITTTHSPTFQTTLLVDRRLRIEDVSIKENNAERKTRWTESRSESSSRVVVFLSDQTQGKQIIRLRGNMPMIPGTPIQLPSVRVEDCDMGTSEVFLSYDSEIEVALTSPSDWKPVAVNEQRQDILRSLSRQPLGRFQLTDLAVRGTIQSSARHSHCSSQAAVLLSRTDGPGWHVKYRLELTPVGESPARLGLTFPSSFKENNAIVVERAEIDWHEPQGEFRQLDLILNRNTPFARVALEFELDIDESKQRDLELPLPTPLLTTGHETFVVIEQNEAVWFPKAGRELRVSELPEWTSSFFEDQLKDQVAFCVAGSDIQIQRDVVTADLRPSLIRLLDQQIWKHQNGTRLGITHAFLSSLKSDLEFEVPAGIKITSIFLEDHPLALTEPSAGRLKIPVTDVGSESLLTITWSFDESSSKQDLTEPRLAPIGIPVSKNIVTILSEPQVLLWNRGGVTNMSSLDQDLDRLETLLNRHSALRIDTREAKVNRQMLDQLYTQLRSVVSSEASRNVETSHRRMQRWNQIVKRLNQLEDPSNEISLDSSIRRFDRAVGDGGSVIRGTIENGTPIRIAHILRSNLQLILFIGVLSVLIPILRRLIRIEWSGWLHQHVAVAWFLLATVWWLFLTPSALGTVLLIVGVIKVFAQYIWTDPKTTT